MGYFNILLRGQNRDNKYFHTHFPINKDTTFNNTFNNDNFKIDI